MYVRHPLRPLVATTVLCLAASSAVSQTPNIRVAGRVQLQYRAAGGDSSASYDPNAVSNQFIIRRLRIQADVRFGDHILAVLQPSFEMGNLRMRDAYLRVGLTPRLGVTMGQEKSPFQRYELTSSNTLPSIERGVTILGLDPREEAMNNVLAANGYVSHDLGAGIDYAAPRFTAKLVMQSGSRESARDVNNAKSFFGRATATVLTNADDQPLLQLGAAFAARDRAVCDSAASGTVSCTSTKSSDLGSKKFFADSSLMTTAFGLDLEYGGFRPGLHVIADFATGDNVRVPLRVAATPVNTANVINTADSNVVTFISTHIVAAYRFDTRGPETRVIKMLEPALRLDVTDGNTDDSNDASLLLTPVLNVYFANSVILRAGADLYWYSDPAGTRRTASQFIMSWQANF